MIRVEESIDAGKLRMKPEVVLMGDVQQRRQALEVLMSFSPFWLRLAVEVVTQKPLQLQGEHHHHHLRSWLAVGQRLWAVLNQRVCTHATRSCCHGKLLTHLNSIGVAAQET